MSLRSPPEKEECEWREKSPAAAHRARSENCGAGNADSSAEKPLSSAWSNLEPICRDLEEKRGGKERAGD